MYLLLSFIIAFGSIFVLNALGLLLSSNKENGKSLLIWSFVISLVMASVFYLIMWWNSIDIYGPTPLFGFIIIGMIASAIISGMFEKFIFMWITIGLIVIAVVWVVVVAISGSNFVSSAEKAKLADVTVKKVSDKIMDLADPSHICLVDEKMALSKAEKALSQIKTEDNANAGSRYDLGSGTKQFVDGQLWWIFPLEFDGYFQWSRFPTVPGYIRVSAENPLSEADAVQVDKAGKKISIKYLNSAKFSNLAERYLRNHGFLYSIIDDWTFEVDDNWTPYYTISQSEWTIGYGGDIVTNVIVFNTQTSDFVVCPIDSVESKFPWIDRANSLDVIDYQLDLWGEYSEVEWKFTSVEDGRRKKETNGWYTVYDEGHCYHFTGWTSYSESTDLIGISLTDANTGKTIYYPTQGSTEDVAYAIATSHWSNFDGYIPSKEFVVYNIYGMLTYVIPVAYDGSQFVGVSLVSMMNKDINAKGKTLDEVLNAYRMAMAASSANQNMPYEGKARTLTIKEKISEVGLPYMQGDRQIYPFMLNGIDKIFNVSYSYNNAKASFIKEGKSVVITYMDTKEKIITCLTFDIPDIQLTDQNPTQAKWIENQKVVKREEARINNIQENSDIIEAVDLGKVDPDSLQKFLESQKNKEQE